MSWSNINPILAFTMLFALIFFIYVAYIITREYTPFGNNDMTKYTSTFNIKSMLLSCLTAWINEQPYNFNEISKSLGISTEKLEAIIKGRIDFLTVDELIDLLIKTGHQVEVNAQLIGKDEP